MFFFSFMTIITKGTKIPLRSYHSMYDYSRYEYLNPIYSITNGKIGLCSKRGSKVRCTHFDLDGSNPVSSNMDFDNDLLDIAMCNVPEGGFLLLVIECLSAHCRNDDLRYQVVKFDRMGAKVGYLDYEKYSCSVDSKDSRAKIFEKNPREYCLTLLCGEDFEDYAQRRIKDVFRFDAKCFNDDDFVTLNATPTPVQNSDSKKLST